VRRLKSIKPELCVGTVTYEHRASGCLTWWRSQKEQGDHLSGKPGNVRDFTKVREMSGEKMLSGEKWPKTVYC